MFQLMCEKKNLIKFHTFGGGVWTKSVKVHTFFFFFRVRTSLTGMLSLLPR